MGVPSQCTIVRAIGRSTRAHKVLSRRNRTQNHTIGSQRKKQLHSVSVKPNEQPVNSMRVPVKFNPCL